VPPGVAVLKRLWKALKSCPRSMGPGPSRLFFQVMLGRRAGGGEPRRVECAARAEVQI